MHRRPHKAIRQESTLHRLTSPAAPPLRYMLLPDAAMRVALQQVLQQRASQGQHSELA
jgi:hypothetical protein